MTLHFAAWTGDIQIINAQIGQGKDITVPNSQGWTALHFSVWNMHKDVVTLLLRETVDRPGFVNVRNPDFDNVSALHFAAWNGDKELYDQLVCAGADLTARTRKNGFTPRMWGSRHGSGSRFDISSEYAPSAVPARENVEANMRTLELGSTASLSSRTGKGHDAIKRIRNLWPSWELIGYSRYGPHS